MSNLGGKVENIFGSFFAELARNLFGSFSAELAILRIKKLQRGILDNEQF